MISQAQNKLADQKNVREDTLNPARIFILLIDDQGQVIEAYQQQRFDVCFKFKHKIKKGKQILVLVSTELQNGITHKKLNFILHSKNLATLQSVSFDKCKKLLTDLISQHSKDQLKTYFQREFSQIYRVISTRMFNNFNLGYIYTKNEDNSTTFNEILKYETVGCTLIS